MARRMSAERKAAMEAQDALYRAQEHFYTIFDAKTANQRIAIAEKAISISPLCADAFVLLAQHAKRGSQESFDLWRRGVEAGKQALGDEFEEFRGEFWGFMETRPYMRARFGLAWAHWDRDEREEAISHLLDMLELNPNDNQGVRYILTAWLVEVGKDDELGALLNRYDEDGMAAWCWTKALASFRRDGDSAAGRRLLLDALLSNKHVRDYLSGDLALPETLPPFISPGEKDEAVHYVKDFGKAWQATPGALDWVRDNLPKGKPESGKAKAKSKPGAAAKPKARAAPKPKAAAAKQKSL